MDISGEWHINYIKLSDPGLQPPHIENIGEDFITLAQIVVINLFGHQGRHALIIFEGPREVGWGGGVVTPVS